MEITEWVAMLKQAKKSDKMSHQIPNHISLKISETHYTIRTEETCSKCKHIHRVRLDIFFHKSINGMTVFEVGMLYMVVIQKRIPADYAQWHKRIAGKRFIENITWIGELKCAE